MSLKTGIVAMLFALASAGGVFVFASLDSDEPVAAKAATQDAAEPLRRSDPGVDPLKEPRVPPREAEEAEPGPPSEPEEPEPTPPPPEPDPVSEPDVEASYEPESAAEPATEPAVDPAPRPVPSPEATPEPAPGPDVEPEPYELPDGAIMALTVDTIGLREVPVFDSTGAWALKYGIGHDPDTSLPWNDSRHKNTYIAGHRVGFPGTASDRVFDDLGDLGSGDEVVLRGARGEKYRYEVTESFMASPEDSWVTSRLRNKDVVTLQTCTGPNFSKRLIVRAERA